MTDSEALDIIAPVMERLDKLTIAVEKLVAVLKPSDLASFNASAPRMPQEQRSGASGPIDPEPPFPVPVLAPSASVPSQAFRESRDLPAEPFAPFPRWQCPIHHGSKVVPAGVSKRTGKPYREFVACNEPGCDQKPPR